MGSMASKNQILEIGFMVIRIFVGSIFIYAGIVKALNPADFVLDIQNYRLLPYPAAIALAIYLPWLEILCGSLLVSKRLYSGTLCLTILTMLGFIIALSSAWMRGVDISCGCFGSSSKQSYATYFARDILILGLLIGLARVHALRSSSRHR
jgi:putative oxidoreductase